MRLLKVIFTILIPTLVFAQTLPTYQQIDGWDVTFQGSNQGNGYSYYNYRACPATANSVLNTFTVGLPNCFPDLTSFSIQPALGSHYIGKDNTNGVWGNVFTSLNKTTCQDFTISVPGSYGVAGVMVGVTAAVPGQCQTCGDGKLLPGPECTLKSIGLCGKAGTDDVAVFIEQSALITPAALGRVKQSVKDYLTLNNQTFLSAPRVAIGGFFYSTQDGCRSDQNNFGELSKNAYYSSLENSQGYPNLDYDGFLQYNFGDVNPPTNSYRAVDSIYSACGTAPLDAVFDQASNHLSSRWENPQGANTLIVISAGIPNRRWQYGNCHSQCNCPEAQDSAVAARNAFIASGGRVITVFLTDQQAGCTGERANAKAFLRDRIASDPSLAFETSSYTVTQTLRDIAARIAKPVNCEQSENDCSVCSIGNGTNIGSCTPQVCPTPTSTPIPQPTPTSSTTQCTNFDNRQTLFTMENQIKKLNRGVRSATRIMRDLAKRSPRKTKLSLIASASSIEKLASKSVLPLWQTNAAKIPQLVKSCTGTPPCVTATFTQEVSFILNAGSDFTLLSDRALSKVEKTKGGSSFKNQIRILKVSQKTNYDLFVQFTKNLSPLVNVCKG